MKITATLHEKKLHAYIDTLTHYTLQFHYFIQILINRQYFHLIQAL